MKHGKIKAPIVIGLAFICACGVPTITVSGLKSGNTLDSQKNSGAEVDADTQDGSSNAQTQDGSSNVNASLSTGPRRGFESYRVFLAGFNFRLISNSTEEAVREPRHGECG
jgi:hypothetical protein